MTSTPLVFSILAFVGGLLVAAQGPIYAKLSSSLNRDYLLAVFLAFSTAAALTGTLAFITGSFRNLSVVALSQLPPWVWLGGVFGAVHVAISMKSIPAIGVTAFLIIAVAGNLTGASIYDHFGAMGLEARPFSVIKGFGLLLVFVGVSIVARA